MNTISIIIPHYNHFNALIRSLKTVVRQTVQPTEVIIVDDGSTETKLTTIPLLFPGLPIRIIEADHKGASSARNTGFALSSGEFVMFWDADTIARPAMLQELLAALQVNSKASYAYSSFRFGFALMRGFPFDGDKLRLFNYIDTTSLIRRASLSTVVGPFDTSLQRFQDWDLWLTLLETGSSGVFVPKVLFRKIVGLRKGISVWLPSFFYSWFPFLRNVRAYEDAKKIVLKKHHLL